jgi:O-acetyl-ADP-ribose deacetylase (regulator of RNase III)
MFAWIRARWAALFTHYPKIEIVLGDITRQQVDVIVNAAKPSLLGGGGVDGAIHAAGGRAILAECRMIRATTHPNGLPVGHAVVTNAGDLPAEYVVHTVGPDRRIGQTDPILLRRAYMASLDAADGVAAETVAFPLISSGVYGWPMEDAVRQALLAISTVRRDNVKLVKLVVFDTDTYGEALHAQQLMGL